jgi:hypothetical protein
MVTLSLETLSKKAPEVSFIHNFPGPVKSGIARGTSGAAMFVMKAVYAVIGPFVYIDNTEAGERHLFLATSARYPARWGGEKADGVPLVSAAAIARGIDGRNGRNGSGVYSIDVDGESAGPKVEELLAGFRKEGLVEKVWEHIQGEFERITGVETV